MMIGEEEEEETWLLVKVMIISVLYGRENGEEGRAVGAGIVVVVVVAELVPSSLHDVA